MANNRWINQVRNRLQAHIKNNNSTDFRTSKMHSVDPFEIYFSYPRDKVASQASCMLLPSSLLPPNHVIATKASGLPILIHRDRTSLRAYVNQCRHRGSPLLKTTTNYTPVPLKKSSAVTCPYHGWSYDIVTGSLKRIPGEKVGFPCLQDKKTQYGLKELDCFESAGAIWLRNPLHFDHSTIASELSPLIASSSSDSNKKDESDGHALIGYREWYIQANWQLLVETFLESYHVKYLHNDTLGLVAHSNIMVTDELDDYSLRMTVPLKNFQVSSENKNDLEEDEERFWSQTTTTYFLFPNTAISVFKRFVMFLSIQPCDLSLEKDSQPSGSSRVQVWGVHRRRPADHPEEASLAERDMEKIITGVEEDWDCAQDIFQGLKAQQQQGYGTTKDDSSLLFNFGLFEGNNFHFQQSVDKISKQFS